MAYIGFGTILTHCAKVAGNQGMSVAGHEYELSSPRSGTRRQLNPSADAWHRAVITKPNGTGNGRN